MTNDHISINDPIYIVTEISSQSYSKNATINYNIAAVHISLEDAWKTIENFYNRIMNSRVVNTPIDIFINNDGIRIVSKGSFQNHNSVISYTIEEHMISLDPLYWPGFY